MKGHKRRKLSLLELEKRLMFDASITGLITSTVIGEDTLNAAPQTIDNDVTISGTTLDFDGDTFTVSSSGLTEDDLAINNEGTGAGQISISGVAVSYEGTQIGTLTSDGQNGNDLVVLFNDTTSQAALERLIENITYQNTSDDPATSKTFNFSVGALFDQDVDITIVPINESPVVTNNGMTTTEGATEVLTAGMFSLADPDDAPTDVIVTITSAPANGQFELLVNPGVAINSFTRDDLLNTQVVYVHDGGDTTSDGFDFTVTDGDVTLATDTFNITINSINDPLTLDTNAGADVAQGATTTIGAAGDPIQFGTEVFRRTGVGQFTQLGGSIDNTSSQFSLVFTTGPATVSSTPGQVLFESGGSGVGVGLYIDETNKLVFYSGGASNTPEITAGTVLKDSTQYAVVVEIDQVNDELRLHYQEAGDFNWYDVTRSAEVTYTGYTATDHTGGNAAGLGEVGSSSYGGFNGTVTGNTDFTGSIDSDFVIYSLPTGSAYNNLQLDANDVDTTDDNIIYTITSDVSDGQLYRNGVAIGLGGTFSQQDLDTGLVTYEHNGAANASDSFGFSVTDGDTVINAQTFTITVDLVNATPTITPGQVFEVSEDAVNGVGLGIIEATDAEEDIGQTITYSITGGTGAGIFAVDTNTGQLTVLDNSTLDFETTVSYTLDIQVSDDAAVPLSDTETITINVQDIFENTAPVIDPGGPFNVDENAANDTSVGTVTATDAELDGITFSIVSGNVGNAFKISASTGEIQVRDTNQLDFENDNSYTLRIRATDDSILNDYSERNFVINLNDINEAPTLNIEEVIQVVDSNARYSSATGNWYRFYNSNVSYATALSNAAADTLNGATGHLVTITSGAENSFVDSIISQNIWLAASDADIEGTWEWTAGPEAGAVFSIGSTATTGFYENWNGAEPNNGNTYNFVQMSTNGQWYDMNNGSRRYVVEWEGSDVINNDTYTVSHSTNDASDITNGTSVGFVQAADWDAGNTISYSIQAGNGAGIFEIDANTGEIRILDNTNLDASVLDNYTLTIRATEVGGVGLFDEIDITVNFNEEFALATNAPLSVDEASTTTITTANLDITDGDTAATDVVVTITSNPTNGFVALTTDADAGINSFTLDDLNNNRVIYVHDGTDTVADSFDFSVTDGSATIAGQTFNFNVNLLNDAPVIDVNTGTTIVEGGSTTITAAMLNSLDADDPDTDLDFTATNITNGHIEVNNVIQSFFTQDDINNNLVVFVHDGTEGDGSFDIELADDGEDGAGTDTATFTLTKTDVNDSPVFTTNTGTDVTEGSTVTITTAFLNVTDPDDSGLGLDYTVSNVINGQVELSTNPNVPILTFTQDDLDNNRVVFRHDGNEANASFDVQVADGGEHGATTDSVSFSLNKLDVNDAPTTAVNAGSSVNQNSIVILKNAVLAAADTDDDPTGIYFDVSNVVNGQLELVSNPNVAITSFTQAQIDASQIVFRHSGTTVGTQFDFEISDDGENGAGTSTGTFVLSVDNVNDAPIISTNVSPTFDEGATLTITTAMLDSFDPDDFGADLYWTASNLTNGIIQVNGSTQNTFTQADLDNGLVTFIHDDSETIAASFDIQVADDGENGALPDTGTFNMTITPVNEAPTIAVNTGTTVTEGSTRTITAAMLDMADVDDDETGVTYTTSNLVNGQIEVNSVVQAFFTQDDIDNNLVVFRHNGSEGDASFDFVLADNGEDGAGTASGTFNLTKIDVNDAPSITTNVAGTVVEGQSLLITTAAIDSTDPDDDGIGLTYSVTNLVNGVVQVNGTTQASFTQADLDNNLVTFLHDGSETLAASFDIELADNGENGAGTDTATFNLTVTADNDAPTLAFNTGKTIAEGANFTLSNLELAGTDVDNADAGLIYTITAVDGGQLSNTNTVLDLDIGDTFTQADIDNGFIDYTHDGGEDTSQTLSFSISDGALNVNADFALTMTPVNDAPEDISLSSDNFSETTEIGTVITNLSTTDVDRPGDDFTYTLLNNPDNLFSIVGNQLILIAEADYETLTQHSIQIETDDGNGGVFDKAFTLNVNDVSELTLNTLPEDRHVAPRQGFQGIKIEEDRVRDLETDSFIKSFSSGNQEEQTNSFYGRANFEQILRQNTTFEIATLLSNENGISIDIETNTANPDNAIQNNIAPEETVATPAQNQTPDQGNVNVNTIRDVLGALKQEQEEFALNPKNNQENPDNGEDITQTSSRNLYDDFEDTLLYHEKRQSDLKAALLQET